MIGTHNQVSKALKDLGQLLGNLKSIEKITHLQRVHPDASKCISWASGSMMFLSLLELYKGKFWMQP